MKWLTPLFLSSIFSISSTLANADETNLEALELLRPVIPAELTISPKLSFKDNLTALFSDLESYVNDKTPRSEVNNFTTIWTPRHDQQLIEILSQNKEKFIPVGELALTHYFSIRLKKVSQESPTDLFEYYTGLSQIFNRSFFWVPFFELHLQRPNLDWKNIKQKEWIATSFLNILSIPNTTNSKWTRDFYLNLLTFLQFQQEKLLQVELNDFPNLSKTNVSKESKTAQMGQFLNVLEIVNFLYEFKDSRSSDLSLTEATEISVSFFDFLIQLPTLYDSFYTHSTAQWALAPSFKSTTLESALMNSLLLSIQKEAFQNIFENKRLLNYFNLHDFMIQILNHEALSLSPQQRMRNTLNSIFYLRTALALKMQTGKTETNVILKTKLNDSSKILNSVEIVWNEELNKAYNSFLQQTQLMIYSLSLVDTCYRDAIQTPTCLAWRDKFPMKLKESTDDEGNKKIIWEIQSKAPLYLPNGNLQLKESETLVINAPEIYFSFLSKITIPSGHIDVKTAKLHWAWIDVSGSNGLLGIEAQSFPGQKPWIKKSEYCLTSDYLEGVTFMKTPRKRKVDWVGFSIKNPFPKNIFVCSSDAQNKSRDIVGDLDQILDPGMPPEYVESIAPINGKPGGKINIQIAISAEKSPILHPLLISMGGNGSSGLDGQDSPLCNKGKYQAFKIALSHHKQWFQNWIHHPASQRYLKLVSKEEYGDHWYGLFEINLPGTSGGAGGNGAIGGEISIQFEGQRQGILPRRWFLSSGIPGSGGKGGSCGPQKMSNGKDGQYPSSASGALKQLPSNKNFAVR